MYKLHTSCRVCGSTKLIEYLNLGELPLSNNLCELPAERSQRYPLNVLFCEQCGLSQTGIVVDPEILFGHYVYRSSINKGYVDHCRKMAKDLAGQYGLNQDSFVIDIAGNDGALLAEFKDEIGCRVLNVDPAKNLAQICEAKDIRVFSTFWGIPAAKHLIATQWPKADVITATNVFAHVDDVIEFMEAVKMVLKPTGVLVLEFPYLIDFIENNEFDTVYFEHLSYFSIRPLHKLCVKVGLNIMKVEKQNIHGGSVRVHIGYGETDKSFVQFVGKELYDDYDKIDPYLTFADNSFNAIQKFSDGIRSLPRTVAAFAASAKGNTLLNCAGITVSQIKYIIDETPEKIGKYSPGTHIPIVSIPTEWPDYLVILSWNFSKEIIDKCRAAGYTGKFIIPIPEFKIID